MNTLIVTRRWVDWIDRWADRPALGKVRRDDDIRHELGRRSGTTSSEGITMRSGGFLMVDRVWYGESGCTPSHPHRPDAGDTGPKWTGLAKYAAMHGSKFRRVIAAIKNSNGALVSLDLKNPAVTVALEQATNETDIREVFAEFGGAY